jgi:hypothetical protein
MNSLRQTVSLLNLNGHRQEQDSNGATGDNGDKRLVIGVDFGTTYSGVAVVYSGQPDDVDIIKTYVPIQVQILLCNIRGSAANVLGLV